MSVVGGWALRAKEPGTEKIPNDVPQRRGSELGATRELGEGERWRLEPLYPETLMRLGGWDGREHRGGGYPDGTVNGYRDRTCEGDPRTIRCTGNKSF